jgi:hypothetical protein
MLFRPTLPFDEVNVAFLLILPVVQDGFNLELNRKQII